MNNEIDHHDEEDAPLLTKDYPVGSAHEMQPMKHDEKPSAQGQQTKKEQDDLPPQIIHKITIDDTLEGLSLQYGVSPGKIKQYNNLHSDDIHYLKQVLIPNPKCMVQGNKMDPEELLRLKREFAISVMLNELNKQDRSYGVAKYYLEQADWDVYKAAQNYKKDVEREKKHQGEHHMPSDVLEEFRKQLAKTLNLKNRAAGQPIQLQAVELIQKKRI